MATILLHFLATTLSVSLNLFGRKYSFVATTFANTKSGDLAMAHLKNSKILINRQPVFTDATLVDGFNDCDSLDSFSTFTVDRCLTPDIRG